MGVPTAEIAGIARSHQVLVAHIEGLTDEQARQPSLLPDWTVAHVLTHLARNADSVVRRLDGAARAEVVDQYPGGYAGRAAEIAAGAGRPAAELVADVIESAARVDAAMAALPAEAWANGARDVSGAERPAHTMPLSRWREVELHHVDLGLGYTPADWPPELVAACLSRELDRLALRGDPNAVFAWIVGRGEAPTLGPW